MSAPVLLTSGGSTVNRKWVPEVNTGTAAAPTWLPLEFVNAFQPVTDDPNLQDSTVFADGGFSGQDKTGAAWNATCTVMRMVVDQSSPPVYGTAQEYLRLKAIGKFGASNRVQIRFYEFDTNDPSGTFTPRTEAYMGFAAVTWAEQGGDQAAESMVQITLNGKGKLNQISHPFALAAAVPNLLAFVGNPLATAGGTPFRLTGQGFLNTVSAVTIGGTAVTSYHVWSDWEMTGVAAAHAAGVGLPVVVTNAVGPSTTGATMATYA